VDEVEMEEVDQMLATIERLKTIANHAEAEVERLRVSRQEAWDEIQRRADENLKLHSDLRVALAALCLATKLQSPSPAPAP
jgi:hypothetical protein